MDDVDKTKEQLILEASEAEHKWTEEALTYEQHLLHAFLDDVPDPIKDVNGRFIRINIAQAKRFGLSDPAQAVGNLAPPVAEGDAQIGLDLLPTDQVTLLERAQRSGSWTPDFGSNTQRAIFEGWPCPASGLLKEASPDPLLLFYQYRPSLL